MTNLMSERARRMRREKEPAERKLWSYLGELNRRGLKFRQQAPIGPYIADFCEHSARLIIEVDGSQHGEPKAMANDKHRTDWLESQGYRVLRFWNHEVLDNIGGTEIAIQMALGLLTEDGKTTYGLPDPDSAMERLRKKARRLTRLRYPRKPRSSRRSGHAGRHSVPSPLVGEGEGGGDGGTPDQVDCRIASKVGSPPTPSPSPQGGGGSAQRPWSAERPMSAEKING
ncbi:MAG TPA: endonuclease domain-containing protein [Hyphomicrobiaceae bacterium]|nr:endonuclease domain-containing protein [Hyphomicrobiaceae bacterium]